MSAVTRELSSYEKNYMLPMLQDDVYALRRWLLAGTDSYGILDKTTHQRRASRDIEWVKLSTGLCNNDVQWFLMPRLRILSFLRFFNPLRLTFGLAGDSFFTGQTEGILITDIMALVFPLLFVPFLWTLLQILNKPFFDISFILETFFVPHFILRLMAYCKMTPRSHTYYTAQTVLPYTIRFTHRVYSFFEKQKLKPLQPLSGDWMEAILMASSLKQSPSLEEVERLNRNTLEHEIKESLKCAKNAALNLSKMEEHLLNKTSSSPNHTRPAKRL